MEMENFLTIGQLGKLQIGMPSNAVAPYLGAPDWIGKGLGGSRLEAFCNRSLQIGHYDGRIILLGIYFDHSSRIPPTLPLPLGVTVPFQGQTTIDEFKAFLGEHRIHCRTCNASGDECMTNLKVGINVTACFEQRLLRSLQASEG